MFDETGLMNSVNGEFNFIKHLNFYQKLIKQLITLQCHIQSYFEAGILVWDSKLRPPNVLISGVSFRHCSLLQSHESVVLSYSECKIAKIFQKIFLDHKDEDLHCLLHLPHQTPQLHDSFSPR